MMLVAAVPPLFRALMDPRFVAHYEGDIRRANVRSGASEKLLARYPLPVDVPVDVPVDAAELDAAPADPTARTPADDVLAARCPGCGYTYEVAAGNELEGFAAGNAWSDIPDAWTCPDCGVRDKVDFVPLARSRA